MGKTLAQHSKSSSTMAVLGAVFVVALLLRQCESSKIYRTNAQTRKLLQTNAPCVVFTGYSSGNCVGYINSQNDFYYQYPSCCDSGGVSCIRYTSGDVVTCGIVTPLFACCYSSVAGVGPYTTSSTPAPTTSAPMTMAPTTSAPVTSAPLTPAPTTSAPLTPTPTTSAPLTPAPTTSAPLTPAPTTSAPLKPAPTTSAPMTPAPTTGAPLTPAPTTSAPLTAAPTMTPVPTTPINAVPPPPPSSSSKGKNKSSAAPAIAGAVGGVGAAIALVAGLVLFCIFRKKKRAQEALAGELPSGAEQKDTGPPNPLPHYANPVYQGDPPSSFGGGSTTSSYQSAAPLQGSTSRVFAYEELLAVTNGFSPANIIGQGGFSKVYKGTLPDSTAIAVKVMRSDPTNGADDRTFFSEMAVMSRLRHKYLLAMLGYATAGTERIIIFELCKGGNLYTALHRDGDRLDWNQRVRTSLHVTVGLEYLHEGVDPPIIHRDVKSANVLFVDETRSFAKLSDFGIAKYEEGGGSASTRVLGTRGYVAPEYMNSGQVTKHSDVYSHGVLLGELITGRPCLFQAGNEVVTLRDWIVDNRNQPLSLIDPALGQNFHPQQAIGLIQLAVECMNQERPKSRPTMPQIRRRIEELINIIAPTAPARAAAFPSGPISSNAFSTDDNILVARLVGPATMEAASHSSSEYYGPPQAASSPRASNYSDGAFVSEGAAPNTREMNMTNLQPFTKIMEGR